MVSSNNMTLSLVSWLRSFKAAKRPGVVMSRRFPPSAGTTTLRSSSCPFRSDTRPARLFGLVLAGPSAPLGLWHLAQPLEEAPAVALEVECLVDAIVPQVIVQPAHDLCTRGERALVVRIDVVDVHGDVLAPRSRPPPRV